jgi:hypothetical protein
MFTTSMLSSSVDKFIHDVRSKMKEIVPTTTENPKFTIVVVGGSDDLASIVYKLNIRESKTKLFTFVSLTAMTGKTKTN